MKNIICVILAVLVLLTVSLPAAAEETLPDTPVAREPGQCGEDLYWSFDDGTLTIQGTGAMDDFEEEAPWALHREEIRLVLLSGAVTKVGANAFRDYDALERVEFGGSLQEIGTRAFKSCDSLTGIVLPSGFRRFGEESFMSCAALTEIHCNGGMPSFNLNCLWDTFAKIYYPAGNPWPLSHIEQLESAFQGRIEFLGEDGTDPYVPTEATRPEETEPPATEPEQTVPETTVPVTEPERETAEQTEPETEPSVPETTQPAEPPASLPTEQTAAQQDRDGMVSGVWMGLCLITGTLSLVLLGALIFRRRRW